MNQSQTGWNNPAIRAFLDSLQDELKQGLMLYWDSASQILDSSNVRLNKPSDGYFSIENNFFSTLFLYSYVKAGLSKPKRILYVAVNQCLRGMVTGCDNILDNEYKKTLDTNLPASAEKFRSILDIMVSDRILTAVMHRGYEQKEFFYDHILQANTASLHALLDSGIQEASEEEGAGKILTPEKILKNIHPLKTGILFQAPWALPEMIEKKQISHLSQIKDGLFQIGMGCQVLDDMVDLSMDVKMNRHNYVAALIWHGKNAKEKEILERYQSKQSEGGARTCDQTVGELKIQNEMDFLFNFPTAKKTAGNKALLLLEQGAKTLFDSPLWLMIPYSIDFLIRRIGAGHFFDQDTA